MDIPKLPTVFTKYQNAVCGHDDDAILPAVSNQIDYEAEFAFVIGKRCHKVSKDDWKDVVWGYTIVHDVSARDYQLATKPVDDRQDVRHVWADGAGAGFRGRDPGPA